LLRVLPVLGGPAGLPDLRPRAVRVLAALRAHREGGPRRPHRALAARRPRPRPGRLPLAQAPAAVVLRGVAQLRAALGPVALLPPGDREPRHRRPGAPDRGLPVLRAHAQRLPRGRRLDGALAVLPARLDPRALLPHRPVLAGVQARGGPLRDLPAVPVVALAAGLAHGHRRPVDVVVPVAARLAAPLRRPRGRDDAGVGRAVLLARAPRAPRRRRRRLRQGLAALAPQRPAFGRRRARARRLEHPLALALPPEQRRGRARGLRLAL